MIFEIFVVLWVVVLAFAIYYFVKSLNAALAKGHEPKAAPVVRHFRLFKITPRHEIPTGHGKRHPAR